MSFQLPRVYPLTDTKLSGLSHKEQVRRLAMGGASLIQMREKAMTGRQFYEAAKESVKTAHEFGIKLIINDRADIAAAVRADGVHLGQDDLPPIAAREMLGPDAIIGLSTHNLTQAQAALDLPINYLALGPIFSTTTKNDTAPELGVEALMELRRRYRDIPLVAIGGISTERAPSVIGAGADSVAVVSALLAIPETISSQTAALFALLQ